MKIRTQISLGYFCLGILLIALGIYSLVEMNWLIRINQSLTGTDFQARKLEIEELSRLEDIFNYDLKFWATQDRDYLRAMNELQAQYEQTFSQLKPLISSPDERALGDKIDQTYSEYKTVFQQRLAGEGNASAEVLVALDNRKYDLMQSLRQLYPQLDQVTHQMMQARLEQSESARARAQRIAMLTAGLAIALALGLSLLMAQKISRPLAKLIQGTRTIARGDFGVNIPVEGRNEFGELAQAFNSMAKKLHELEELKKGFVSHVSHELKSPLAAIRETSDLLMGESLGPLNDQQRRLLRISLDKSQVLSRRINDLLDLSRIEAGVMEYCWEPTDLSAVLKSAVESASPLLMEKNLKVESQWEAAELKATVDSQRIAQVLENLLSNAIKFSKENSSIRIHCARWPGRRLTSIFENWDGELRKSNHCDPHSEYWVVSVEDEGVGIPPHETRKIFQRFYQSEHGHQASKVGTGLGLAISKNIVEAHQGVIWVESDVDRGSRFHFALPTSLRPGKRMSKRVL